MACAAEHECTQVAERMTMTGRVGARRAAAHSSGLMKHTVASVTADPILEVT